MPHFGPRVRAWPDFFRFVNGAYGVDVVRPVARLNKFGFSVTFEKLEHDHKFVIYRTSAQTIFVAIGHELQDVLARDLVDKRSAAPMFKEFV